MMSQTGERVVVLCRLTSGLGGSETESHLAAQADL